MRAEMVEATIEEQASAKRLAGAILEAGERIGAAIDGLADAIQCLTGVTAESLTSHKVGTALDGLARLPEVLGESFQGRDSDER